jgi:hypothetical protein
MVLHGEHIFNAGLQCKHPSLQACGVTKKYSIKYLLRVSSTKKFLSVNSFKPSLTFLSSHPTA